MILLGRVVSERVPADGIGRCDRRMDGIRRGDLNFGRRSVQRELELLLRYLIVLSHRRGRLAVVPRGGITDSYDDAPVSRRRKSGP